MADTMSFDDDSALLELLDNDCLFAEEELEQDAAYLSANNKLKRQREPSTDGDVDEPVPVSPSTDELPSSPASDSSSDSDAEMSDDLSGVKTAAKTAMKKAKVEISPLTIPTAVATGLPQMPMPPNMPFMPPGVFVHPGMFNMPGMPPMPPMPLAPAQQMALAAAAPVNNTTTTTTTTSTSTSQPSEAVRLRRQKREARMAKNRESANASRIRRKQNLEVLQKEVAQLTEDKHALSERLAASEAANAALREQNEFMQRLLTQQGTDVSALRPVAAAASTAGDEAPTNSSVSAGVTMLAVVVWFSVFSDPSAAAAEDEDVAAPLPPQGGGRVLMGVNDSDFAAAAGAGAEDSEGSLILAALVTLLNVLLCLAFVLSAHRLARNAWRAASSSKRQLERELLPFWKGLVKTTALAGGAGNKSD